MNEIMSEEAINELIDGFEIVGSLTEYGRENIKYHFQRLQKEKEDLKQEITKLKGVIETYEILIKANNINNWNELKKLIEEKIQNIKMNCSQINGSYFNMDYVIETYEDVLKQMQELENRKV